MRAAVGLLGVLLSAGWAPAEVKLSPADAAVVKRVDAHYNHLRSLRTQFRESYDGMGIHRDEAGTLLLSKPGRMRWSYTAPAGKVFVMDGKFAWSYVPGDAQAQRISAKQMDDLRSPLRLLLGHAQLERELGGLTVEPDADGGSIVRGVPQTNQAKFAQLVLHVRADGSIERLTMIESDGAKTEFAFTGTEENVPVRDADFVFTPPIGVPIVEGLPPI